MTVNNYVNIIIILRHFDIFDDVIRVLCHVRREKDGQVWKQ